MSIFVSDKEYQEGYHILQDLSQALDSGLKIVENKSWVSSGKYLFESYMIVKDDKGLCYKVDMEMFGNNPRDDYQYIKLVGFNKVNRVKVTTYVWEVVK